MAAQATVTRTATQSRSLNSMIMTRMIPGDIAVFGRELDARAGVELADATPVHLLPRRLMPQLRRRVIFTPLGQGLVRHQQFDPALV